MPVPTNVLDGVMKYGSITVTIGGVSYIANTFDVSRPVSDVTDMGATGLPTRARYVAGKATFTAELQCATSSTAFPQFGDTFSAEVDANYGAEDWVVLEVNPKLSNDPGSLTTLSVTGSLVLDAITTS